MTEADLRALFNEAYKIIRRERDMRGYVFANEPDKLQAKVAEMDRLLEIVTSMKDELKLHVEPTVEQLALIDVPQPAPRRAEFN